MLVSLRLFLLLPITLLTLTEIWAQECKETTRGQIEAVLDKSTNRILLNEVVDNLGEEGKQILVQIAGDLKQSPKRRGQAISLLGEHRSEAGKKLLLGMLSDYPTLCGAIHPLQEYRDPNLVPQFISLLDDRRSCGNMIEFSIGGDAREKKTTVFVSDEAVDALERVTGKRLEKENDLFLIGHRATQPWKEWWKSNRIAFLANPLSFMTSEERDERQDDHYPCSVETIATSPDSKLAFSAGKSFDPWVRAWDVNTRQQIWATPTVRDDDAMTAMFSPDGQMVAMGTANGAVKVFDTATGRRLHMLIIGSGVNSVAFSQDGTTLASASDDGRIQLFDTKSWCETKQIDNSDMTMGVTFSPDGSLLAAATFEKVRLWTVAGGKEVRSFEVLPGTPPKIFADEGERRAQLWRMAWRVAFSPDGKLLATGSSAAIQLWDLATGGAIKSSPSYGQVGSLYFSPDGQWVVWGNLQNQIVKWNPGTGKRLRIKNEFSMGDTALTSDGKLILSPGAGTDIAIYDFQSRRKVGVLTCTSQRH
jgi:Tol biopolymer transport system component